jgi:hypothetical protein
MCIAIGECGLHGHGDEVDVFGAVMPERLQVIPLKNVENLYDSWTAVWRL